MLKKLLLVLALSMFTMACGDDDGPEDAGLDASGDSAFDSSLDVGSDVEQDATFDSTPDAPVDATADVGADDPFEAMGELLEFYGELDAAFCKEIYECPHVRDDNQFSALFFDDAAACQAGISEFGFTRNQEKALTYAVNTGEVIFDAEGAAQCLTRINGSCSGLDIDDACGGAFLGQVLPGDSCSHVESCTVGNYCSRETEACGGVCIAKKPDGADCDFDAQCVGACVDTEGPDGSFESACATPSPASIAMAGGACGRTSDATSYCARGLFCGRESRVCEAPGSEGDPCDRTDIPCTAGTVCVMETCTAIALAGEGDACETSELGPFCNFVGGLDCDEASSTCVVVGDGTVGASCRTGDSGAFDCNDGLFCERPALTCQLLREPGGACVSNNDCRSDVCDDTTSTCGDKPCNVR